MITKMKKWYGGVLILSLFFVLLLRYGFMKTPIEDSFLTSPFPANETNPLEWIQAMAPPAVQNPQSVPKVISIDTIVSKIFAQRNLSNEEQRSLKTWNLLRHLINHSQALPNGVEAINEAGNAWSSLMISVEEERLSYANESFEASSTGKQCPQFLNIINVTELDGSVHKLAVPCGFTQGSAVTIIGIPNGLLGNFRIDLTGETLPGEPDQPIILHYNVRLHGDKITEDPVIVQNTWTAAHDWGEEERCPSPDPEKIKKVDELDQCSKRVGKDVVTSLNFNGTRRSGAVQEGSKSRKYFPFKQGYPSVATLRVGSEGIQMTVDGKPITSFAYRETLEPWLVSEVRISGDLKVISILASGLPTSEDSEHAVDLESLISRSLSPHSSVDLFIGVFSTANNFKRRMAVRRTWMQYDAVRSGRVAVRFLVGLAGTSKDDILVLGALIQIVSSGLDIFSCYIHKNQVVNKELWNEARTYGDVQLMPFVDYYSIITWKTLAICIFGTEVVSAKFVMKTDDDAFVRVDEVLDSLERINVTDGLLYGLINADSRPHRSPDSKWFITREEWSEDAYPPWAHGPGYVVSHDIAKEVYERHIKGSLKMFKLEDVAMGIWISEMKKDGLGFKYENDGRIFNEGCKDGYVVAHYQGPREMMCLWQKLQEDKRAKCCG